MLLEVDGTPFSRGNGSVGGELSALPESVFLVDGKYANQMLLGIERYSARLSFGDDSLGVELEPGTKLHVRGASTIRQLRLANAVEGAVAYWTAETFV